jgi:Protein of unknown function (DUF2809)
MKSMVDLKSRYLVLTGLLFTIEILIALFVHDHIIRPYIGDMLVVILIYCFVRSFFNIPVLPAAIGVLFFSFGIEALQYFKIVDLFGLQKSRVAKILIGTSFSWIDLLVYTLGIGIVLCVEKVYSAKTNSKGKIT